MRGQRRERARPSVEPKRRSGAASWTCTQNASKLRSQTLAAVGGADPMIAEVLDAHLAEHRAELAVLKGFVASVAKTGRAGPQHPSQAFDPKKN